MNDAMLEKLAGKITQEEDGWVWWEEGEMPGPDSACVGTYPTRQQAEKARKALAVERIRDRLAEKVYEVGLDRLMNLASIAGVL